jgi:PAS domain S-box-containing protein
MSTPTASPAPRQVKPDSEPDAGYGYYPDAKVPRWLVTIFALFVAVVAVGFGYFVWERLRTEQHAVKDDLRSVAELKVSQLAAWRQERLGDAAVVGKLPGLAEALAPQSAAPPRWDEIDTFLNTALRAYAYREIHLLDRALRPVRSYPADRVWDGVLAPRQREELLRANDNANRAESPLIEDLHLDKTGLAAMHVLVRVRSASGELAGVALLTIAAESGLFGLVQSWPVESATAETLLLRREGERLLALSPLRFKPGAELNMELPLTTPDLLAAKALRAGAGVLVQGNDYRGEPVIGLAMPVPGTPWTMISKMDRSEAYAKAWKEFWQLSAALLFFLLVLVLFGRVWLHIRQSEHIGQRLESERKRRAAAERLALVMRHANDVIFLFDESMRIVEANERAVAVYGYTLPELRQLTAADLRTPEANAEVRQHFAAAQADQGFTFETTHRRKEGATFSVEVSSRPVMVAGHRHVLSIIRDISERKAHEQEIARLGRLYRVISEVNQVLVRTKSREELFGEVCRVLVERGSFRIAWVGWLNWQTRFIEPLAVAGDTTGYTQGIRIAADAELPEGRGPSGTAFREGRVYVTNDFFADPNTGPWRERAARAGFNATIALPLQQEGGTLGLLTVYALEKNAFGAEEIELLRETAGNISFALEVFAREHRRREAEAALLASENRLQFIVSATPAIIYSLRAGGNFATTFLSPNIRNVLGYERAAVMGDSGFWPSHLHPDDAAFAVGLIGDLEKKSVVVREYRFRHADGSWRWMHDEMQVVRDAQGRATELVGYWFDITERKAAEESLKAREEIFSSIVGQAADAIALVEVATGRFLEFNRAAHEGLGYTREEFAAFRIGDIQAEHSEAEIRGNIGRILETGGAIFESRHRCHDGSLRDVRVSAKRLHVQGRDCIAAVWSDITESKRTEAELRKLSVVVEQSPITVVITDLTGAVEYVNPRFTELTGYTPADVIGKNPRLLKSRLTDPEVYTDLWRTITRGRVWRGEITNRKKSGETFVELCIITPVVDAQGRPTHYLALKEDITARLQSEKRLRQLSRIVEQAPLSIAITDLSGAIDYVNPTFLAVTGYALEEVLGQNPRVLKSGATPPETYEAMWQTLTRGESWRGELTNKRKDGSIYVEQAIIAPVVDESGVVKHYVALKEDITERKRTEAALRETQERYRLIAENTSDSIWLYNLAADKFEYCSPSVFKLRGFTPAEVMQQGMAEVLTPESVAFARGALAERLARFVAGDKAALTQFYQVDQWHRNGSVVATEISTTLITDAAGRVTHILGVTRDITERKRSEAALRQSEQRFRELFDLESDTILVHEIETGRITMANQAASQTYGYPIERLLTMQTDEISADPAATRDYLRQLAASEGKTMHVPLRRHRRADGTIFPVAISNRVFRREGQLLAVSVIRDITLQVAAREALERFNAELEQKVAERTEELAARNREIEALLQSIPDLVMRLHRDGTILNFQPAKGATPLAAVGPTPGASPGADLPEALWKTVLHAGANALAGGTSSMVEVEITLATGPLTAELRVALIGQHEYVVFVRDITARKRLEAETAAMLERERQVSEMKTRFISVTSHEFRTPMTAAMGSVELLANHFERLAPPKRQELLGRVTTSLHRLTEMLDEVLLLNRMDANRVEVNLVPVSLRNQLHSFIEEIRLGDRDAHAFDFQVSGEVENFATDLNLLHHIVSNLLSNAVRYSPAGSKVTVCLEGGPERVKLSVRDQGIGIPEQDRSRIFEPFERGSNVGNIKGTGLGLNIVKRMTEMLGGTLAVEPVAPTGSCFTLSLPRLPPPPPRP